jgi:hypothetical protein
MYNEVNLEKLFEKELSDQMRVVMNLCKETVEIVGKLGRFKVGDYGDL